MLEVWLYCLLPLSWQAVGLVVAAAATALVASWWTAAGGVSHVL
jgi:hypothetical protein